MDNLGFQSDGKVYLKRYSNDTAVYEDVNATVVNEIVQKVHDGEEDNNKDKGEKGMQEDQTESVKINESGKTEETQQAKEVRKDDVSGITGNEGENLLLAESEGHQYIQHSICSQKDFDDTFVVSKRPPPSLKNIVGRKLAKCQCSRTCIKGTLYSIFPFINILQNYSIRQDMMGDIVAGLTVGIMHIPQGMGYAMLATLSPVHGLYTSFFPVLVYFFFGTSKHIALGTASVVCLMIGSAVTKRIDSLSTLGLAKHSAFIKQTDSYIENQSETTTSSAADDTSGITPEELELRLQFALSITFSVGVIQLLMATFRLGFIIDYMSDVLISGFTTGVACHVFTSQIQNIFNVKLTTYRGVFKLVYTYRDFFGVIGTTNYFTVILSVVSAGVLYCTSRFINQNPKLKPKMFLPVPIELIVVVLGTVFSYVFDFEETFQVAVVSDIPTGLPVPNTKAFSRISWTTISDAFPIVIIIFSMSLSIAKLLAKKHNYEVDANQELLAFGVSAVVCSFLSSIAPTAALSRTVVQERVGGRTQVAGLVSCCLLLVVLLAVGQYFRTTPKCVLAAVIVVALKGMFSQILDLKSIYDVSKRNFIVWIVAFVSTLLLDVDLGLGVSVAFNLLIVIYRIQRSYACLLGQMPGTDLYMDRDNYQQAMQLDGIKIFRYEQSLFFLNKEHFRTLLSKNTVNPTKLAQKRARKQKLPEKEGSYGKASSHADKDPLKSEESVENKQERVADVDFHTIIIDCSPWSFIDTMGIDCLRTVILEYREAGIKVVLANCRDDVQEMFIKTKFYDILDHSNVYVSLHDAVSQAVDFGLSSCSKQACQDDTFRNMVNENGAVASRMKVQKKRQKKTKHVTDKV